MDEWQYQKLGFQKSPLIVLPVRRYPMGGWLSSGGWWPSASGAGPAELHLSTRKLSSSRARAYIYNTGIRFTNMDYI